ncbi:MAG: peptidoglycan bridge formation glycyltransferase FemA/FemB family protein [Treponema sp.]|nr:peptidoglycan bridge formation glycyltransferase FemA/FemB family protein [Treponema sp.]
MTNNLSIKEIQETAALDTGCRFLQSAFWASFKGAHGWTPKYFEVTLDNKSFKLTVLVRSFKKAFFHFSLAYIPMAPEKGYEAILKDLSNAIKAYLPKDTMCMRYDLPVDFEDLEERKEYVRGIKDGKIQGLVKADVDIQPPDTVLLNLQKTEDELLANMKNKWRYNIRLATKKGVEIKAIHAGDADFASFQ